MDFSFLNNTLENWALALAITFSATGALYVIRGVILRRMHRAAAGTRSRMDDLVTIILRKTYLLFMLALGLYLGSLALDLTAAQGLVVSRLAVAALLLQVAIYGDTGLRAWRDQFRSSVSNGPRRASSTILCFIARLMLWVVFLLTVLDNFGFNITTLVASLGIGGVAVALAVQSILGDLFASLSIMLDKPFEIDDFIIVGDALGTVEHIGLKTTRLRGLGGEQIIFSNSELLKSRIHNHKRMWARRVAFVLRVNYGLPQAKLAKIPEIVREVVSAREDVDFERTHFFRYGEWSLDFEVVYHFRSPDYILHMDAQQDILMRIYQEFERAGIPFAHPLSIVRLDERHEATRERDATALHPGGNF